MNYRIERHSGESAYMQLYHQLRSDIVSGVLPKGTKLPSRRVLAAELGLSVITVEHALALLTDEGYTESRPRSGFIVSFDGLPSSAPLPQRPTLEDMQASRSAPEDFPFSILSRTMRDVLTRQGKRILDVSPRCGCMELRQAIAAWLGRSRSLQVRPEQIVIGSGSEYFYGLVVRLLGRERPFGIEDPSYETIRRTYESCGAVCRLLPMASDGISSPALENCDAGVLHVTPYHSYPSGVTATPAKRREYAHWAETHNAVIVEDDYDSELAPLQQRADSIFSLLPGRVLYVNSFSKIIASALRTAFLILPDPLPEGWAETLQHLTCPVPVYNQLVLAEFLNEGHLERYVSRRRKKMGLKK